MGSIWGRWLCGVLLLWVALVSPVQAGRVSAEETLHMMQALMPAVESLLGRHFQEQPALRVLSLDQAVDQEMALRLARSEVLADNPELQALLKNNLRLEMSRRLAWYSGYRGEVGILVENTERINRALSAEDGREMLRCELAHELTHAMQDQYLNWPIYPSTWWIRSKRLLMEGQAMVVMDALCQDRDVRAQTIDSMDLYQPDLGPGMLPYREGWRVAALAQASWGAEGLWALIAGDMPRPRRLLAAARASTLRSQPQLDDLSFIGEDLIRQLEPTRQTTGHLNLTAEQALYTLWFEPEHPTPAGVMARVWHGQAGTTRADEPDVSLSWILVRDPAQAARWLEGRCVALLHPALRPEGAKFQLMHKMSPGTPDPVLRLQEAPELLQDLGSFDASCAVQGQANASTYRELWVLHRSALISVASLAREPEAPSAAHLQHTLKRLLRMSWDTEEPDPLDNWRLQAMAPTQPYPAPTPGWSRYFHRAMYHKTMEQWSLCATWAHQATVTPGFSKSWTVKVLEYECSIRAGDPDRADQAYAAHFSKIAVPMYLLEEHLTLLREHQLVERAQALEEDACGRQSRALVGKCHETARRAEAEASAP